MKAVVNGTEIGAEEEVERIWLVRSTVSSVISGYYFNSCRGVLSAFESYTEVIISCILQLPCDVIMMSPRLILGSGTQD